MVEKKGRGASGTSCFIRDGVDEKRKCKTQHWAAMLRPRNLASNPYNGRLQVEATGGTRASW